MRDSKKVKFTIEAFNQGYRVTPEGQLIGLRGKPIQGSASKNRPYFEFTVNLGKRPSRGSSKVKVHQLQAYQKFGEKAFEEKTQVRHLDGNPQNNSWDNIAIGTARDNMMDRSKEDRQKHAQHAANCRRKVTPSQVRNIRKRALTETYKSIGADYDISKGNVSDIVNRRIYKNVD